MLEQAKFGRRVRAIASVAAVSLVWVTAAATATGAALPAPAASSKPEASSNSLAACGIGYRVLAGGRTTYVSQVTLTNRGAALTSWTVGLTLPAKHVLVAGWSAVFQGSRGPINVTNAAWNGTLKPGASVTFGFVANYSGALRSPGDWSVNGVPCASSTTTTTITSPTTTTTNPTTPTTNPTSTSASVTTTNPTTNPTSTSASVTTTTTAGEATSTTGAPPSSTTTGTGEAPRVDNPYVGARGYVNPEWAAKAAAEPGGTRVSDYSTAIWLDRIAAIEGTAGQQSYGAMGVRDHLDEALRQQATAGGEPVVIQFVLHNLPVRNCRGLVADGELGPGDLQRYKSEYVDAIASIEANPKYDSLRIVNLIEPDSLTSLITSLSTSRCADARNSGAYLEGVRYAVWALGRAGHTYQYVDAGHHAILGWDANFVPGARVIATAVNEVATGWDGVAGVVVNVADYAATVEPFLNPLGTIGGMLQRSSRWIDWNMYADEESFATAFRAELVRQGFPADIGVLIDTSRNGWGGSARPAAASTSTDLNTFVNESRIDRRLTTANWCNQEGAGLGARPSAAPAPGIDAHVWAKPPGESDGSSVDIANPEGRVFTSECDPTYLDPSAAGSPIGTGALAGAPIAGAWFSSQFRQLMANAYPPLD